MAEGGRIDYDIGLDASRASAELEKLKGQLNRLTADFQNATNTIKNNVEKMTRDLRQGSDPVSIRRYDNALARSFSTQGRGSFNTQLSEAATRQIISESKAAAENTTARISNELVNQFGMRLRNMDDMVQARLRREVSRTQRYLTGSSPELLQAQEVLQQRRNESALREARYGRGAVINDNVWERFNHRGGADMMALQGRLMGNAMALSMLWNVMSSGRQFVVELDKEFRQFQAITATTNSEMESLSDRLIDVSEKSKFTALEVAQAATLMGQAGLSAREVGESIEAVTMLATAAGVAPTEAMDITTSVMSIFNLQARETMNVSNVLTTALNNSKLTLDKLTLGMQYAGNVAAQLGVTYQELVATLGALANSGIRSGSTLGTGLRQLLIDIQNPSKAFRGVMENTGLTDEDLNVESQGLLTVLNNLKDAGIGAAQAFEIFQVRSAAAFVALANNLDTAKLLEQELLLTADAVKANATQMQSLSNTYDKFTSVVGTLAFEAFEPLTKVLQRGIDTAANFLSILRQYPEVLNTIGILVGTIAAATIFSTLGAMVRGLAGMVPIFATFSKGAQGSALAMTSLGSAAATTGGILRGLWAVVARHPLVMMLTLLSSAVMGIEAFLEKTDTIADRIDFLKGKINETQGEIDTLNSRADAINQAIGNVINQKAALDRDPLMRQTKILEVVLSFKELAQEIDYTTSSVDDLISALSDLQSIDMGKALPHYKQMVDNIEVLLETQQRQLDMLRTQNRDFFQEVQGSQNGTKLFGIFDLGWGTAMTQGDVVNRYSKIDPNMGRIAEMMMPGLPGSPKMPEDYTEALGVRGEVLSAIATREGELGQLVHQRDVLRRSLTDEETARVAQLENELTALRILSTHVEKRVAIITEMTANEAKLERARQQELEAQIVSQEDFATIQKWTRHALADTSERLSTFLKSSRGLSPQEQRDGVQELADALKDTQDSIFESIDILVAELKQANPDLDEEQARIMLRGKIEALTAQSQLNLVQQTDKLNEVVRQIEEKEAKDQIDTLQKELVRITRNAGKARSQEELEEYREHALQVLDKIRELHTTIYNLVNEDADPEEVLKNNSDFQKTLASINEKEQEITEGLEERSRRLVDNHYKAVQDSLNDEIKATEKKLKEINDQIKKTNPGAALDALVAQWKELFAHLQQLLGFDNAVEFQQGMHSARMPIPKGSAVRANEAMQHYLAAGLPKHIAAGIVGNLLVESGLKTGAVGDNGTAFGLAQWRLDRNTNMRAFANQRGVPWTDTKAQLDFVLHEMQGPYKHVMEALLKTQTADQATKVFMDLYERPNKDPKINHIDRRRGYASELASMDYHSQAQSLSDAQTTHDDALKSTIERSTKNAVAAAVNNANKQIQAAIAQAKASPDLGVINNLITEVDDRFKEVLEQRLKEFDTVNKKALEEGDEAVILQRQQLVESLNADRNQKISQLLEEYYKTLDDQLSRPVEDARARLDAAQRPENEGRFTSIDIASMEENVRIAEREELIKRLAAAEEHLARVREELARYEAGSTEHTYWLNEEARARERVAELQRQQNIEHQIANQQMPSINQRIMEANIQWGIQNGLLQQNAKSMADMVPLADQVGQAWGQILDGLTNAFSQLFMDLASGTMSAEEAFKKFGLSVIQMLMQMIAKALAYQMVMGLMGGGGGGGSLFGGLMTGLFGVPGMANGGRVRGAATGEFVQGGVPTRDSVLRSVMPGEFILRRSAVQAIGEENLTALNNAGNRINSPGIAPMLEQQQQAGVPQTLNVWVVSPDQQPPPGPNDIVAVVADNISRRGSLKALIQQVQTGTI